MRSITSSLPAFFRSECRRCGSICEIDLELEEKDAFDFILESGAVEMPFAYAPELNGSAGAVSSNDRRATS